MSVVVASIDSSRLIARCIDALSESCRDQEAELIVVPAGHDLATETALASSDGPAAELAGDNSAYSRKAIPSFGKARVENGSNGRLRIILGSPVVPFVLALRVRSRVWHVPFYRKRFLAALPLLIVIAACWAAGEAAGAMEA